MIDGIAIMRALKGVLAGELGEIRTIESERFQYHPGLFEEELDPENSLFLDAEHHFDIIVGRDQQHSSSPLSVTGSSRNSQLGFTIRFLSSQSPSEDRLAFQGRIINARSQALGALAFRQNLRVDDRGKPTAIVGGLLVGPSLRSPPEGSEPTFNCNLATWSILAVAIVEVAQEVS